MPCLGPFLRMLPATVLELDLRNFYIDDSHLSILAECDAAETLESLAIAQSTITDSSASVWNRFKALKSLSLVHCRFVNSDTVEEICKLSTLQSLTLQLGKFDLSDALSIFFSSPHMAGVKELILNTEQGKSKQFDDQLRARHEENPNFNYEVRRETSTKRSPFCYESAIDSADPDWTSVTLFCEDLTPELLARVADRFCKLDSLEIKLNHSLSLDCCFDRLTCVTSLSIEGPIPGAPDSSSSLDSLDQFVSNFSRDMKQLTYLYFNVAQPWKPRHVATLLSKLSNLGSIGGFHLLSTTEEEDKAEKVQVCHPSLLQTPSVGFDSDPLFLPSVTFMSIKSNEFDQSVEEKLYPSVFPHLTSTDVTMDETDEEIVPSLLEANMKRLEAFGDRLVSLELNVRISSLALWNPSKYSLLSRLSLSIEGESIGFPAIQESIDALPQLSYFYLDLPSLADSRIKHPRISELVLSGSRDKQSLEFSSLDLPALCRLSISACILNQVRVSSFNHLHLISLEDNPKVQLLIIENVSHPLIVELSLGTDVRSQNSPNLSLHSPKPKLSKYPDYSD
jgi:hypothetical protein